MSESENPSNEVEAAPAETARELAEYHDSIVDVLAAKILLDWLRNRQQLLVPFTLDLAKLEPHCVEILVHAMAAAARASGAPDGPERSRVESALQRLAADENQRAKLTALLERPRALADVLADVRDLETGALVYAASLLAIDQRDRVNRHYLRYLAARLRIPDELVKNLERRFRAAA